MPWANAEDRHKADGTYDALFLWYQEQIMENRSQLDKLC